MLLYIHIPFCHSKCGYCSFGSFANLDHLQRSYVDALIKELDFRLSNLESSSIESLYFGGGTPSILAISLLEKIFLVLKPYLKNCKEITIEANPNIELKNWLKEIKDFGVDRVSFGVQSFDNAKLKTLQREHDGEIAKKNLYEAKKIGSLKTSLDLIYGVVGDNRALLKRDIELALSLEVGHLSAYSLVVDEKFGLESKRLKDENLEIWFIEHIKESGFFQYEVSNFSKNHKSLHNLGYWRGERYIGVGACAIGFDGEKRYQNSKNLEKYIKNPFDCKYEILSKDEILFERIFLGLRSEVGVDVDIVKKRYLDDLVEANLIEIKDGKIYSKNYMLSDEIALKIS